jgi:uncharacterized protein (DUF2461 family)
MKKFIEETQGWLNRRLRQIIWKRWKKVKTKYEMLRKYGINHGDAKKMANTRKGYWHSSKNEIIHGAIPNEKLRSWGLKDMNKIYEKRYLRG